MKSSILRKIMTQLGTFDETNRLKLLSKEKKFEDLLNNAQAKKLEISTIIKTRSFCFALCLRIKWRINYR